jgi:hypothetical protein
MNIMTAHLKLVTFGIGLGITFVIGTTIGLIETQQAHAILAASSSCFPNCK